MGYIFTEFFFDTFKSYVYLSLVLHNLVFLFSDLIVNVLPYVVKYLIGYCNFYYQLGYGVIFYIYFFRRHKAKKLKNWNSFYNDSISN